MNFKALHSLFYSKRVIFVLKYFWEKEFLKQYFMFTIKYRKWNR